MSHIHISCIEQANKTSFSIHEWPYTPLASYLSRNKEVPDSTHIDMDVEPVVGLPLYGSCMSALLHVVIVVI